MLKKSLFILLFLTNVLFIYSENYNIENGISLSAQNTGYSIILDVDSPINLKSPYDRGTVIRFSDEKNNPTGFEKFIEIEYKMGFEFEDSFMEQGSMRLLLSNIENILVTKDSEISKGDNICLTKSGPQGKLRVFILSDTSDLQFLKMWTQDRKIQIDNQWYWDASYLFN